MDLIPSFRESLFSISADPMMDISEVFLDTIFEEGVIREIPIIRTIASIAKAGATLRERQMAKNTYAFIKGLREKNIPQEKIEKEKIRLSNPITAEKEIGFVLLMLEREAHAEKAQMSGRAFAAVVDQDISWEQYQELIEALDRMFMKDFAVLERIGNEHIRTSEAKEFEHLGAQRLKGLGLVIEKRIAENRGITYGELEDNESLILTSLGKLMIRFMNREMAENKEYII